jgi:hypothetical protein
MPMSSFQIPAQAYIKQIVETLTVWVGAFYGSEGLPLLASAS